MHFSIPHQDVQRWLTQYHTMRAYELSNGESTQRSPVLTVFRGKSPVSTDLVAPFGDDNILIVFVLIGRAGYSGAVLQRKENVWLTVKPPRVVSEDVIGVTDPIAQLRLLSYLLHQA